MLFTFLHTTPENLGDVHLCIYPTRGVVPIDELKKKKTKKINISRKKEKTKIFEFIVFFIQIKLR